MHSVCSQGDLLRREGSHPIQNILTESKRAILREGHYHEEHEGHKVGSDSETLRDLRVLRGRQVL